MLGAAILAGAATVGVVFKPPENQKPHAVRLP